MNHLVAVVLVLLLLHFEQVSAFVTQGLAPRRRINHERAPSASTAPSFSSLQRQGKQQPQQQPQQQQQQQQQQHLNGRGRVSLVIDGTEDGAESDDEAGAAADEEWASRLQTVGRQVGLGDGEVSAAALRSRAEGIMLEAERMKLENEQARVLLEKERLLRDQAKKENLLKKREAGRAAVHPDVAKMAAMPLDAARLADQVNVTQWRETVAGGKGEATEPEDAMKLMDRMAVELMDGTADSVRVMSSGRSVREQLEMFAEAEGLPKDQQKRAVKTFEKLLLKVQQDDNGVLFRGGGRGEEKLRRLMADTKEDSSSKGGKKKKEEQRAVLLSHVSLFENKASFKYQAVTSDFEKALGPGMAGKVYREIAMRSFFKQRFQDLLRLRPELDKSKYRVLQAELLGSAYWRWQRRAMARQEEEEEGRGEGVMIDDMDPSRWELDEEVLKDMALIVSLSWLELSMADQNKATAEVLADDNFLQDMPAEKGVDEFMELAQDATAAKVFAGLLLPDADSSGSRGTPGFPENSLARLKEEVLVGDLFPGAVSLKALKCDIALVRGDFQKDKTLARNWGKVTEKLEQTGLSKQLQLFLVNDLAVFSATMDVETEAIESGQMDVEGSVPDVIQGIMDKAQGQAIAVVPREVRPRSAPGGRPATLALAFLGLCTSYAAALNSYSLNDSFQALNSNDIGKVLQLSGLIVGLQLLHDAAHLSVAAVQGMPVQLPRAMGVPTIGLVPSIVEPAGYPKDNNALIDFSLAGPLVGLVASTACFLGGLVLTASASPQTLADFPRLAPEILASSQLLGGTVNVFLPEANVGVADLAAAVPLHPAAVAGVFGVFANVLSLIPFGRNDGANACRVSLGLFSDLFFALPFSSLFCLYQVLFGTNPILSVGCAALFFFFRGELVAVQNEGEPVSAGRQMAVLLAILTCYLTFIPMETTSFLEGSGSVSNSLFNSFRQ